METVQIVVDNRVRLTLPKGVAREPLLSLFEHLEVRGCH